MTVFACSIGAKGLSRKDKLRFPHPCYAAASHVMNRADLLHVDEASGPAKCYKKKDLRTELKVGIMHSRPCYESISTPITR
jgi:hypothetical protein